MRFTGWTRGPRGRAGAIVPPLALLVLAAMAGGCASPEPLITFLDEESNLSFTHPPRWNVGFAEQSGLRYRYLTAPRVEGDAEALSVTFIAPTPGASAEAVASAYLSGASAVVVNQGADVSHWAFKDSSGVPSRLRLARTSVGRYFGAWVRGSEPAMKRYAARIDAVLGSLRVEDPTGWPEERFAGMIARAPASWTRGSRLSSATSATMQFKSLPLFVERGSAIHGFVTLSKEPVPPPGDLETFNKIVRARASDTVAVIEHHPWLALQGIDRAPGYVTYMRSGTTLTSTRVRRWITVRNGVGLTFACEARADAFDRLDPWCRQMAYTVRLE